MKICNVCGNQLPDAVRFCNKCGSKVSDLQPGLQCPKCGGAYPAGTKFCKKDGTALAAVVPPAAESPLKEAVMPEVTVKSGPLNTETQRPDTEKTETKKPDQAAMLNCPICGGVYPAGTKFCKKDGTLLSDKSVGQSAAVSGEEAAPVAAAVAIERGKASETPVDKPQEGKVAGPAATTPAVAGEAPKTATTAAGRSKTSSAGLWIILLIVLLAAIIAGGYFAYKKYFSKDSDMKTAQVAPAPDSSIPATPATPYAPTVAGNSTEQKPPIQRSVIASTPQSRIGIKASALINDVRNGRPYGFGTNFRVGASRVAHYVMYTNAVPNQTT
jgi:hypothetical protein